MCDAGRQTRLLAAIHQTHEASNINHTAKVIASWEEKCPSQADDQLHVGRECI